MIFKHSTRLLHHQMLAGPAMPQPMGRRDAWPGAETAAKQVEQLAAPPSEQQLAERAAKMFVWEIKEYQGDPLRAPALL